jgi:hypothetical protein
LAQRSLERKRKYLRRKGDKLYKYYFPSPLFLIFSPGISQGEKGRNLRRVGGRSNISDKYFYFSLHDEHGKF